MLYVICAIFFIGLICGEDVGDPCVPTQNITEGECRLITDCEIAVRVINEQEKHPFKRCGFKGVMEIICCPNPPAKLNDGEKKTSVYKQTDISVTPQPTKDLTTIADKQCKKIRDKTLPPFSLHIVGGMDAAVGEFPHMVAIGYSTDVGIAFKCGGALISENFVLTAAHCASNPARDIPIIGRMGVVSIGNNAINRDTDVNIVEIIIHPQYKEPVKYHDVALLRLEHPVVYSPSLIPACIYTGDDIPNVALTVTGWGRTSSNKDVSSTVLQKANVTAASHEVCKEGYSKWRKLPSGISRGQFCAGDANGKRDTCQGDSGGPLQALTEQDGYYRIIGITSFGRGCGGITPGVYTRVSVYREWIESVVWPNEV